MTYTYISTQDALNALVEKIHHEKPSILSVDTEFVRKSTYWPKLCLIQLCFLKQTYIIDALAASMDLSPLKTFFDDKNIQKIFHSGRQDIEILYRLWGTMPKNIEDTQILGMVTGFGDCASYEKICDALLQKKLDKSQQHTDWGKRPLTQRQLDYAAADVIDLEEIHQKLIKKAGKKRDYTHEELNWLTSETTYQINPDVAWEKIKVRGPKKPHFWGRLQALAKVREEAAIKTNTARGHVIKDDIILQLAEMKAASQETMENLGIKSTSLAQKLCNAFQNSTPFEKAKPQKMKKSQDQLLDLLKLFLKLKSDELSVAPKLLATKDQLINFVLCPTSSPLSTGWRQPLFGHTAKKLLDGKAALAFDAAEKTMSVVNISGEAN